MNWLAIAKVLGIITTVSSLAVGALVALAMAYWVADLIKFWRGK